jgi:hypothetical protein
VSVTADKTLATLAARGQQVQDDLGAVRVESGLALCRPPPLEPGRRGPAPDRGQPPRKGDVARVLTWPRGCPETYPVLGCVRR